VLSEDKKRNLLFYINTILAEVKKQKEERFPEEAFSLSRVALFPQIEARQDADVHKFSRMFCESSSRNSKSTYNFENPHLKEKEVTKFENNLKQFYQSSEQILNLSNVNSIKGYHTPEGKVIFTSDTYPAHYIKDYIENPKQACENYAKDKTFARSLDGQIVSMTDESIESANTRGLSLETGSLHTYIEGVENSVGSLYRLDFYGDYH
jgi:hypothetical protein